MSETPDIDLDALTAREQGDLSDLVETAMQFLRYGDGYDHRRNLAKGLVKLVPSLVKQRNDAESALTATRAELEKTRAVVEAARLCVADIKAAWSDERSGPWLTAGQRALYAALDAYDTASAAGAGDGEQDTATTERAA